MSRSWFYSFCDRVLTKDSFNLVCVVSCACFMFLVQNCPIPTRMCMHSVCFCVSCRRACNKVFHISEPARRSGDYGNVRGMQNDVIREISRNRVKLNA